MIVADGRVLKAHVVYVPLDVYRGSGWCTWCDQPVDSKGRLRNGEVCCEDPTPVLYDQAAVIRVTVSVLFNPVNGEALLATGFIDNQEFVLTTDEQDQAIQAATEVW